MGGDVVQVSARDTYPSFVAQVFVAGRIATIDEQRQYLDAKRKREEAREARRVERAARRFEREVAERKIDHLTAAQAVELLLSMGWTKTGGA